MAVPRRHLIFLTVAAAIFPNFVQAASAGASGAGPQVELRFTVFGLRVVQGLAYFPDEKARRPADVKFYNNYRSPVYHYRGSRELSFYDREKLTTVLTEAGPEEPLKIKPVARCRIPDGVENAFLLFFPRPAVSPTGDDRYDILVVDDGVAHVPPGGFIIINASRLDFAAQINTHPAIVGRNVCGPFKAENGKVSLLLARRDPGYENLTLCDQWKLDDRHRSIVILFPITNPANLLPDYRRLSDRLPVADDARSRGPSVQTGD